MFKPNYTITPIIAQVLMRIEACRKEMSGLPLTPNLLITLRESARLQSVHYSTAIEGNRLSAQEVAQVLTKEANFPGRERDAKEVLGYYAALDLLESAAQQEKDLTETVIKTFHALVMAGGKKRVRPTPYRDSQNVIRDGRTRAIVYLPPEAKDVPQLMKDLFIWIKKTKRSLPCPLVAGIAHYQFATIHPYFDGNGRTARLFTTLILHLGGYDLKGLYSLEEYYARALPEYYKAISLGPSHNYYQGRAEVDITPWLEYFCAGVAESFEAVVKHAKQAYGHGAQDRSGMMRTLDARQKAILTLLKKQPSITAKDIETFFCVSGRTARWLCLQWVKGGFLTVLDASKKNRMYALAPAVRQLFEE